MTSAEATAAWGYAVSFTTLLTAVISPFSGWFADTFSCRRTILILFVLGSPIFLIASAVCRNMHIRMLLVTCGYACYNLHFTFLLSLLPNICVPKSKEELSAQSRAHQLSIVSTALSNLGAGVLLAGVIFLNE